MDGNDVAQRCIQAGAYSRIMTVHSAAPLAHELRRDLGKRLRLLRLRAGLTGRAVANGLGCHPAKVSRIENGQTIPSIDDVRNWCVLCSAEDQSADLEAQVLNVESAFAAWRTEQRAGFLQVQREVDQIFADSHRFRVYEGHVVPGLLQTEAYTREVLTRLRDRQGTPDDIDAAAAARYSHRRILSQSKVFSFVLEEAVLASRFTPPQVMREQLAQLLEDSRRPQVSLGVIPFGAERTCWPVESFYAYDDHLVRVQLISGRLTVTTPGDVAEYLSTFEELASLAVVGDEARELIQRAMR